MTRATSPVRDSYFDNAKVILILFVVLGHAINSIGGLYFDQISTLIYLFHMPAFALVSGYFTKKTEMNKIGHLLYLYCGFQVLYTAYHLFILKASFSPSLLVPSTVMWFLFALILWRIITPYVLRYKAFVTIPAAVLLALYAGVDQNIGSLLALSRTICFYPFFLAGAYARRPQFSMLKRVPAIVPVAVFLFSYFLLFHLPLEMNMLRMAFPYSLHGWVFYQGIAFRALIFGWSFILICCFLMLVPDRHTIYSYMGQNTLPAYLIHHFFTKAIPITPIPARVTSPFEKCILYALCLLLGLGLMSNLVSRLLGPLLYPKKLWGKIAPRITRTK